MHFIDKVAKLSHDCTRLADKCADRRLATEIATLARKLLEAANEEAAIEPMKAAPLPEPTMFPDAS